MIPPQLVLGSTVWELSGVPDCITLAGSVAPRLLPACAAGRQSTWPSSRDRLCCIAGRGSLSQIPQLCFSPTTEVPAGTSPKSPQPRGIQARCCASGPGKAMHQATHPIKSTALLLLQANQRVAMPTAIPAETCALITKAQPKQTAHPDRPLQKPDRMAAPPTACQQLGLLYMKANCLEFLELEGASSIKLLFHRKHLKNGRGFWPKQNYKTKHYTEG